VDVEQIDKIQTFVADELARDGGSRCDQLELINGDSIGRNPTPLRTWRDAALCRQSPNITAEIVDTAKAAAAETGPGRQRFLIKSHLKDGGRQILWFVIASRKKEEVVNDPYRTSHAPEVKIDGRIAAQLLRYLEQLIVDDKRDSILRYMDLAECDQALRTAIARSQEQVNEKHALKESLTKARIAADRATQAAKHAERLTEMAATIAAGIWARNDPVLDLGDADSKAIVAKLARETAELILLREDNG
jgi:hypothetical protein